ncbi:hypothetical protein [Sphaerotilus natans]|uniref:hypothetical protein n=1 Tax=Sphaerotilus natans TaxID=34103 RepID=UPI001115520A|nr:hypothetical protein [Sphaerotilus natans]
MPDVTQTDPPPEASSSPAGDIAVPVAMPSVWPITVQIRNDSAFPISDQSTGMFVPAASSVEMVLFDAEHARHVREAVTRAARTICLAASAISFVGFPDQE